MVHRSPRDIALDIHSDYMDRGKSVPDYVMAYLEPMMYLSSWDEAFGADEATHIARYAMSNLSGWRGEKAREVKAEVKSILKDITGY